MVVVMAPEATQEDVTAIVDLVRTAGGDAFVSRGVSRTIVGLVGDVDEFGAHNKRVAAAGYSSRDHPLNVELTSDFFRRTGLTFVSEYGAAWYHSQL